MSWGAIGSIAVQVGGKVLDHQSKTSGKPKLRQIPVTQSEAANEARGRLLDISRGGQPETPLRQIADIQPLGEERTLARETATEMAQPQDIFSLPEVQGIIQQSTEKGNLLANRLGRMLKASGNLTSTTGRDVLGRAVTDVQGRLAADLAPFAQAERDRRRNLIPILESLGITEEGLARNVEQAKLDAAFNKKTTESRELQDFTIPLLKALIELQPAMIPLITQPQQSQQGGFGFGSLVQPMGDLFGGGGSSGGSTSVFRQAQTQETAGNINKF